MRTLVVWCPRFPAGEDPALAVRAFEPVVVALEAIVPAVVVERPGLAAFAARGPARFYGGEEALARRVAETVREAGAECRVGIAGGLFAAEQAARRGSIVGAHETTAFLSALPVDVLDDEDLSEELRRLGLATLGDLAALPAPAVADRFGDRGTRAHRLARGLDEAPLIAREPPPDWSMTMDLDPPADRIDTVAFAARSLTAEFVARLAARGLTCAQVVIEAETTAGEQLSRRWRTEGLASATLTERVRWQLDAWVTARASRAPHGEVGGLRVLRLTPDGLHADHGRQLALTDEHAVRDEQMELVLARLQGMLGEEAVATPVFLGGRTSHDRERLAPWGHARPSAPGSPSRAGRSRAARRARRGEPEPSWPGMLPAPSPATLYRTPRRAEVHDASGARVEVNERGEPTADPARISVEGGPLVQIAAWAGPWPLCERWWDLRARRWCARMQLLTADGRGLLASVQGGRWLLEGVYD
ncbi:MAG TPA: DNA polymerase Y family protein [Actinomycetota bacterium]